MSIQSAKCILCNSWFPWKDPNDYNCERPICDKCAEPTPAPPEPDECKHCGGPLGIYGQGEHHVCAPEKPAASADRYFIDGHEVWFDAEMKPMLDQFIWTIMRPKGVPYAAARVRAQGKRQTIQMHRLLTGMRSAMVDHINGNTLDNRLQNLRRCNNSENQMNKKKSEGCTSKYKGVHTRNGKSWSARIRVPGKQIHIGTYKTEEEAARAYDEASRRLHGNFGRRNFED